LLETRLRALEARILARLEKALAKLK